MYGYTYFAFRISLLDWCRCDRWFCTASGVYSQGYFPPTSCVFSWRDLQYLLSLHCTHHHVSTWTGRSREGNILSASLHVQISWFGIIIIFGHMTVRNTFTYYHISYLNEARIIWWSLDYMTFIRWTSVLLPIASRPSHQNDSYYYCWGHVDGNIILLDSFA